MALARDALVVSGPDACSYLQGQLSQDVAGLEVGASAWSWLLQPAGKVDALVRVTRTGPDTVLVDVDKGYGEAVLNRLTRFKLRTKAEFRPVSITVIALRGPGAEAVAGRLAGAPAPAGIPGGEVLFEPSVLAVRALWPVGEEALDVVVRNDDDTVQVPDGIDPAILEDRHDVERETERIVAGVPAMGAELTEKTIPAETGLVALTASFTKGCYTGQELVARIDSRGGNVPRHLRGLRSEVALVVGTELVNADGKVVATVTSAATSAEHGPVALAYVGRGVEPGGTVSAAGVIARVVALPAYS
jgi:folate-binding protein YgfZ